MPVLDLTIEQVIELVKQLPAEEKKAVLEALQENQPEETEHPWMKIAGKYADDPQFDEMLAYIEEDRRQLDAEMEEYYQKMDAEEAKK
ncbi:MULTISPECIES: hypothetical protein [unclassified Spirulina]|uniref:hypothetical protein n=1 Tax=unclassified Spirulina TaxID=2684457 RepID=UPI00194E9750|nr:MULTISPECIES: hypothetical protein [Spirulina]MEA5468375.1 hypothetical protein [Spirulina sp. 06S082]